MFNCSSITAWPKSFIENYNKKGYWKNETFGHVLMHLADIYGDDIAIENEFVSWSFKELDHRANQLAAGFHRLGLRSGNTAVVQLPNVPEFYAVIFALIRLGVKPLLTLPAHRRVEIKTFCNSLTAEAYIFADNYNAFDYFPLAQEVKNECPSIKHTIVLGKSSEFIELNSLYDPERILPEVDPQDVALFLLSGGSTGVPKLIPRTHNDYLYSLRASADICKITRQDTYFCILPAAHNFALSSPGALGCLCKGAKIVLGADPTLNSVFNLFEKSRATVTALTPSLARLWLDKAPTNMFKTLRLLQVGGARLDAQTAKQLINKFNCQLQQVFGMAEGLVCYTQLNDPLERIIAAETLPISSDDEIKIINNENNEVADNEDGDLWVRGPYTIRGYYDSPEINKKSFDHDGFYCTGDRVRRTHDGRLIVTGRTKDVVNRGGELFAAEEVEMHLRTCPAINDAAVFAIPDERFGEVSCAMIILRSSMSMASIRAYLRSCGLASFKIPDKIHFIDSLPKTAVGKIDKRKLRENYLLGFKLQSEV